MCKEKKGKEKLLIFYYWLCTAVCDMGLLFHDSVESKVCSWILFLKMWRLLNVQMLPCFSLTPKDVLKASKSCLLLLEFVP